MAGVLFFLLHQQRVILRNGCCQKILLFDQVTSQRAAHHTAGNQSVGSGCRAYRCGTGHTKVLQHRAKGAGRSMSAHHGYGAGAHAHQHINMQNFGKTHGQEILCDNQYDDQTQKADQGLSAAL